jgi:cytochrome c oxidase assembly protein subunit 15
MHYASTNAANPWPHRLAVVLVCATFPLIWVGGLVTTYEAGMAVPDWPTTYGYNLFLYPWQTWILGPWDLFIEHGHRLLGAGVGLLTIALLAALWRFDSRRWLRWLGVAALAAVIFQGLLGGMRVRLDERLLAKIHGCFGPAFFGLSVALAVFTSKVWRQSPVPREDASAGKLHTLALLTTFFAYLQIVLGAQLRHVSLALDTSGFRVAVLFHLLVAAVLLLHVVLLALRVGRSYRNEALLVRPALALLALVGVQLALGASTWVLNYGWPNWFGGYAWAESFTVQQESQPQALVTTAHVATGSLILVTALLVSLRSWRLYRAAAHGAAVLPLALGVAV